MQFIFIFTLLIVSVYALASDDHDDLPVNNAPANSYANSHVATPKGDGEDHKKVFKAQYNIIATRTSYHNCLEQYAQ